MPARCRTVKPCRSGAPGILSSRRLTLESSAPSVHRLDSESRVTWLRPGALQRNQADFRRAEEPQPRGLTALMADASADIDRPAVDVVANRPPQRRGGRA